MTIATPQDTAPPRRRAPTPARVGLILGPALALAMLWLGPPAGLSPEG